MCGSPQNREPSHDIEGLLSEGNSLYLPQSLPHSIHVAPHYGVFPPTNNMFPINNIPGLPTGKIYTDIWKNMQLRNPAVCICGHPLTPSCQHSRIDPWREPNTTPTFT